MEDLHKQFSKIYDQYVDKIYRFIFIKVNSEDIAKDICSETFMKGWLAFQNEKKIDNIRAFLYQIARNLVTDYYRQRGRTQVVSADFVPIVDPREDLEKKSFINSDLERVKASLVNLKEDYQNVIIWYYIDGVSVPEIAKNLGRSEGTTRVLIHRALKALKDKVNEGIQEG